MASSMAQKKWPWMNGGEFLSGWWWHTLSHTPLARDTHNDSMVNCFSPPPPFFFSDTEACLMNKYELSVSCFYFKDSLQKVTHYSKWVFCNTLPWSIKKESHKTVCSRRYTLPCSTIIHIVTMLKDYTLVWKLVFLYNLNSWKVETFFKAE